MRSVILIAFGLASALTCQAASYSIRSWSDIYEEINSSNHSVVSSFEEYWTNSVSLRHLVEQRHTNSLIEFASQPDSPMSGIIGYFALKQVDPASAGRVGLELVLTANRSNLVLIPVIIESVVKEQSQMDLVRNISSAFSHGPIHEVNAKRLIMALSNSVLLTWFEKHRGPSTPPTYTALVVEQLWLSGKTTESRAKLTNVLEELRGIPGVPRMVFLKCVSNDHPLFYETLKLCLEDQRIPDELFSPFVYSFAGMINEKVDLADLKLSEKRRTFILRILQRFRTAK